MLSSLPKLADKAFVLGLLLPTLLFLLALIALFSDQEWTASLVKALVEKDGLEKLAYVIAVVWGLSVVLMMLNHVQFQLLEGYLWPVSRLSFLARRERARFTSLQTRFDELNAEWRQQGADFAAKKKAEWEQLRQELVKKFPTDDPTIHLPTRFGNAIRAFEVYSGQVYGADSIPLWLHLSSVIPKEMAPALDDARAQVNCVVNICFLAAIVAAIGFFRSLAGLEWSALSTAQPCCGLPEMFNWQSALFLAVALAAAIISRLAYRFSIVLVYAWGDLVKAAFDCSLPALAEKLGYKLPATGAERKAFWIAVSEQAIYWRPLVPEQWKPAEKKQAPGPDAHT